jgi:hypothetical protein
MFIKFGNIFLDETPGQMLIESSSNRSKNSQRSQERKSRQNLPLAIRISVKR